MSFRESLGTFSHLPLCWSSVSLFSPSPSPTISSKKRSLTDVLISQNRKRLCREEITPRWGMEKYPAGPGRLRATEAFHLASFETGYSAGRQESFTALSGADCSIEFASTCSQRVGDMTTSMHQTSILRLRITQHSLTTATGV